MVIAETTQQRAERMLREARLRALPINERSVMSVDDKGRLQQRAADTETFEQALERRVIKGYAVIWGQKNLYGEIFARGAFDRSIRENGPESDAAYKIKFLAFHKCDEPLTLFARLFSDDVGLYFETKPLDEDEISDKVLMRVKSGALNNFSVGFDFMWDVPGSVEWNDTLGAVLVKEARLFEISVVSIPADMNTYVKRSLEQLEADIFGLDKDIQAFINGLNKSKQLEARQLFARQKSLIQMPPKENAEAQTEEPRKVAAEERSADKAPKINYSYLINNL